MQSTANSNGENLLLQSNAWLWFASTLTHLAGYILFGSYYENGSNTYMKISTSGQLFGTPEQVPPPVAANVLLSDVIAWCYELAGQIPWYDLFSFAFSIVALKTLMLLLVESKLGASTKWAPILVSIAFYFPNVVLVEFTRISMVMAFAATAILLTRDLTKKEILSLYFIGLCSMLIRPDSYALAIAYAIPAGLLANNSFRPKRVLPLLIAFGGVLLLLNIPLNNDSKNYLDLRPYQITLFDFDVELKEPYRSEIDSTVVSAVRYGFLNDGSVITPERLAVYVPSLDKTPQKLLEYLERNPINAESLETLFTTLDPYSTYTPWIVLLLLLAGILILPPRNEQMKHAVIFGIGGLLSFAVVGIYFKTVAHVLYPSFICVSAGTIFILRTKEMKTVLVILMVLGLTIGNLLTIQTHFERTEIKQAASVTTINQHVKKQSSDYADEVFVYGLKSLIRTNSSLFGTNDHILPNSFSFDNGFLYHSEAYRSAAKKYFQTTETVQIMQSILSQPERFTFVAEPSRLDFLRGYFKKIHNIDFEYSIVYRPESELPPKRTPSLIKLKLVDA
jgi:hypothetical protein